MDCLFCKIVAGDMPGEVVHTTERTVAFRDLNAQAPTHVLVVPKDHYANAAELAAGDPAGSRRAGAPPPPRSPPPRATTTTGSSSTPAPAPGQTVFHTHLHLLAGRPMTWPPG